jgi:hypothetical protein
MTKHYPQKFLEWFQIDGRKKISDIRIVFFSQAHKFMKKPGTKHISLKEI